MRKNIAMTKDLYDRAARAAAADHISVDEFVSVVLKDQLASREYIDSRARLFDRQDFERALDSIPDREPEEHDRLIPAAAQDFSANIDQLLRIAIEKRRVIRLRYQDRDRILEPHDYGIQKGLARLLAYQVGGSSSGKLPNWRWLDVNQISDIQLLDRTFRGGRPAPSGKHQTWDELFIRVKSAEV